MRRLLAPLAEPVTYSRWVHLVVPMTLVSVWLFIEPGLPWQLALLAVPLGLLPVTRTREGVQAQLLLTPRERGRADATISVASAKSWGEKWRTVLWLELRLLLSIVVGTATVWLPLMAIELARAATSGGTSSKGIFHLVEPRPWYAALTPLPLLLLLVLVVLCGRLSTAVARRLLGPSRAERVAALEELTEQLLERNRIARELHDSIGHALTVSVVQAGAARTAGDPEFTRRALVAIEETCRAALDDLERVLRVLREPGASTDRRPTLIAVEQLLDSARGSGVDVDAEVAGHVDRLPAPLSREGYRILQESLTNALRHAGRVPVRVRIAIDEHHLELDVRNPLAEAVLRPAGGHGLQGMRERAKLLGGSARAGPREGEWQVHVRLPLQQRG
ncbi:sensor histidine kinase [Streptomyces sp. NBC_00102]|uniref:sensor histidine kinase n=1 Tax=Streptomyces sp. NBC_00102 TaxID=2975652 RepID=UPI002253D6AE|nr:histidine kinase [Streptomyces sp. NBC_00102]MCX5395454.1 histidine kinase [Streptomyces sp. NBC_00102]